MDSYSTERKVSDFPEADLSDMLDNEMDIFDTPQANIGLDQYSMDNDWLDRFFEDDPILNDKMMSEALHPPQVRSDHSYSLSNGESGRDSPLNLCKADMDKELDLEFLTTAVTQAPNMTSPPIAQPSTPSVSTSPVPGQSLLIKREPVMPCDTNTANLTMTTQVPCTSATTSNLVKQPTIILTTQAPVQHTGGRQERLVLPKVNIKVEPSDSADDTMSYDGLGLPPTPPSSTNSDSEGSLSPQRSAPSSPLRHNPLARPQPSAAAAVHTITQQPLFTSPIPQSGVLILTEEEKRTLIAEGYPIPNKLPLTKQEEKNLKKIRRKIKNKISAQESRRKKKEYLESLERRVEGFSQENNDLKKKVEQLENNNRSLLGQLQKLQSLVSKVPRPSSASSTQTGTCLMVLVLCFAIFLGSWSPLNFSIGYSSTLAPPVVKTPVTKIPMQSPMGPEVKDARVDAYTTPNMRSRVLLSMKEEPDEGELYGPHTPFSYRDMFVRLFIGGASDDHSAAMEMEPPIPRAHVMAEEVKVNETVTSTKFKATPAVMHPDIAANVTANVVSVDNRLNTTS